MFDVFPILDGPVSPATSRGSLPIGSERIAESFHSAGVTVDHPPDCCSPDPDTPTGSSDAGDPAQHGSLPARTACHSLSGLASPDSTRSCVCFGFFIISFDAASCSETTTRHPLIGTQQDSGPYRFTSYRDYEHSHVDIPFGIQHHHHQFLEWVGEPESAPGEWLRVLSWEQTLHAELQLQRDANLMTSNLSVLQQYALSLHGTASAILQSVFGRHYLPAKAVHDAMLIPCVRRAFTHMVAMGLWRPPLGPGGPGLAVFNQGPQCAGCPTCDMRTSGW